MPAPSIILPKPLIMIEPGGSYQDGTSGYTPMNFGTIVSVYGTCDLYAVGQNVSYLTNGQTLVNYSNVEYAIVEESKILTNEGIVPP
jgi:hypothetical protein